MIDKNSNSRERIIQASIKLFARKGYEGTKVKEIAKEAEISQALIYYNFKSKEEIFSEILERAKTIVQSILIKVYSRPQTETRKWTVKENVVAFSMIDEQIDLITILLLESLKVQGNRRIPLEILNEVNNATRIALLQQRGIEVDRSDIAKKFTDIFFLCFPTMLIAIFGEEWCRMNNVNKEEMCGIYTKLMNLFFEKYTQ